uniref:Uncharacterized protein n=1 Tax=Arundo donax TaxID=35708 RepID=A0A0A9HKG1_ARUDO
MLYFFYIVYSNYTFPEHLEFELKIITITTSVTWVMGVALLCSANHRCS